MSVFVVLGAGGRKPDFDKHNFVVSVLGDGGTKPDFDKHNFAKVSFGTREYEN
jgi:hypothetical protein